MDRIKESVIEIAINLLVISAVVTTLVRASA